MKPFLKTQFTCMFLRLPVFSIHIIVLYFEEYVLLTSCFSFHMNNTIISNKCYLLIFKVIFFCCYGNMYVCPWSCHFQNTRVKNAKITKHMHTSVDVFIFFRRFDMGQSFEQNISISLYAYSMCYFPHQLFISHFSKENRQ